jgi:hypothetical protein
MQIVPPEGDNEPGETVHSSIRSIVNINDRCT